MAPRNIRSLIAVSAIIFFSAGSGVAQIGLCPMSDVQLKPVTTTELDTTYLSVFDRAFQMEPSADSTITKDIAAVRGWANLIGTLNQFLNGHDFHWGAPTKIFCRFYFSRGGSMEYVLTDCKTSGFDRQTKLCLLLREFSKTYQFPLKGLHAFSHCGMITFSDNAMGNVDRN